MLINLDKLNANKLYDVLDEQVAQHINNGIELKDLMVSIQVVDIKNTDKEGLIIITEKE